MVHWDCRLFGKYLWNIIGNGVGGIDCEYSFWSADIPPEIMNDINNTILCREGAN